MTNNMINDYNDHIEHLKSQLNLLKIDPSHYNVQELLATKNRLKQVRKKSVYQDLSDKLQKIYDSYTYELELYRNERINYGMDQR